MTPSGAYIFGCSGPDLSQAERAFFKTAQPWGFILFARNIETPEQVRRLTRDLRAAVGWHAPVLVDQEGGRVQRLTPPHWSQFLPPMEQIARSGPDGAARALFVRMRLIADELCGIGIDVNCAPMADIASSATHPFLRNRCYGSDPVQVAVNARAAAQGLLAGGVLPVLKHIPGHGRASVDSHLETPVVEGDLVALAPDFAPFAALADLPLAMTGHLVFPALDPGVPATSSPVIIGMIRKMIGFDGLLMTDDISMQALTGSVAERSVASLEAGCDIVLHCNGVMNEMQQIAGACGSLAGSGAERAQRALAQRVAPEPMDRPALEAELAALIGIALDGAAVNGAA
ncbi:MAG: beta-N-acetylhexosaminidase [Paracoccaceae bacterium]|jgi:beta-N-acetylhexosaminidase